MRDDDRRNRSLQRERVEQVLPEREDVSMVLRKVDGSVVVYEQDPGVLPSTDVRGVVLPDGELLVPDRRRFARR